MKDILAGKLSPIAAIAGHTMRVRGDLEFGRSVYALLAADKGRTNVCP